MNQTYYDEKIKTLPENLQYAVIMSDWRKALIEIQNKFKLHIDQTQVLEDSVVKLMFGDIDAPDFISNMFSNGHVNSETAADILLEVDLQILKKIRQRLEAMQEQAERDAQSEDLLMDDDERKEKEEASRYANFYAEAEKINKEVREELIKEGIKEDGSNITDEMLGIKTEIPDNIDQEKEDMLKAIESPEPVKPKIETVEKISISQPEVKPINPDHQLQNKELETPFHEENVVKEIETKPEPKQQNQTEIKKPININLNDIYREPIE